jgi:hypothetical protein
MQMLPNLNKLSLATAPSPLFASHGLDVGATLPPGAVKKQVESGKLRQGAMGILASAGAKTRDAFDGLTEMYKPTASWRDKGWSLAYWHGLTIRPELIVDLQDNEIAYALLGGAAVDPSEFIIAIINKYWSRRPGRRGSGTIIDPFLSDSERRNKKDLSGTHTEDFFKSIVDNWNNKHEEFNDVDKVLNAVRSGEKLPLSWEREGMQLLERYMNKLL